MFIHSPVHQFSSVTQLCLTLCDPKDCSMPGLPFHHQLLESTQTHVHWVGDAIKPSHPLSPPSPTSIFPSIRVFSNESALFIRCQSIWVSALGLFLLLLLFCFCLFKFAQQILILQKSRRTKYLKHSPSPIKEVKCVFPWLMCGLHIVTAF